MERKSFLWVLSQIILSGCLFRVGYVLFGYFSPFLYNIKTFDSVFHTAVYPQAKRAEGLRLTKCSLTHSKVGLH